MKINFLKIFILALFASTCFASPAPQPLKVLLDGKLNTTHAPLVIAQQQGFFKEQGLDVQLIDASPASNTAKLIADNKADIGLAYEPQLIEEVDRGLAVIRIGTLIDKPLNCIVALKQSGIKSLADLKGKEVGSLNNKLTNAILTSLLTKQGLSNRDIKVVNIPHNLTQALLSNKVAAISGPMRNLEVPMLENKGHELVVFFPEEHGIPNYSEILFISSTAHAKDPRFPRFLTAIKKAVSYLDEHPQQAWIDFSTTYPHLRSALNREYWFATIPYFAEDPAEFNRDEWKHFADFMQKNKLISRAQPLFRYAANTANIG